MRRVAIHTTTQTKRSEAMTACRFCKYNIKTMKTAYTLAQLDNIDDYEAKASEFLRLTGSTLQVRYKETAPYFGDDKQVRDIYEFRLTHNGRTYQSTFGDSMQNTWKRFANCATLAEDYGNEERTFRAFFDINAKDRPIMRRWEKENNILKATEWEYHNAKPTEYSILACLQGYEPPATFDDFIAEYGYTIDSKKSYEDALTTYGSVVKEWTSLLTLYTNEELQALASIQ